MFQLIKVLSIFIVIMSSYLTEALRCYNCISPMANDCRDVNQMSSTECEYLPGDSSHNAEPVCLKTVNIDQRSQRYVITKMCAWEGDRLDPCASYLQHGAYCTTCNSKLCNSSTTIFSKWIIGLGLSLMFITNIFNKFLYC